MSRTQTLAGTIKPDGTLELAGPLDLPPGRVRVIVEADTPTPQEPMDFRATFDAIDRSQAVHGFQPRTAEQMRAEEEAEDAQHAEEEARWSEIYRNCRPDPGDLV